MSAPRPVRLRLSRARGFNLQDHSRAVNGLPAVKVDRSTRWGNPYRPGDEIAYGPLAGTTVRDRAHAAEVFDLWAQYAIAGMARPGPCGHAPSAGTVAHRLASELRGRNLACWCPLPALGQPDCCHAAILLRLANPVAATQAPNPLGVQDPCPQGSKRMSDEDEAE